MRWDVVGDALVRYLLVAAVVSSALGVGSNGCSMVIREYEAGTAASDALGALWENMTTATFGLPFESVFIPGAEATRTAEAYAHLKGSHDVVMLLPSPSFAPDFSLMQNITDLWQAHPEWRSTIPEWVQERCRNDDGDYVVIPMTLDSYALFFNRTRLAAWGIQVPTSWADLTAACDTLMAAGHTPDCLRFAAFWPGYDQSYFMDNIMMGMFGYEFLQEMQDGVLSYEDPRFQEVLDFVEDATNAGYITPNLDRDFGVGGFIRGEVPFMFSAGLILDTLDKMGVIDSFDEHVGVVNFPKINPDVEMGEVLESIFYGVPVNAPHPEAGKSYLEHMLSPAGQQAYFTRSGMQSLSRLYVNPTPLATSLANLVGQTGHLLDIFYIGHKLFGVERALRAGYNTWSAYDPAEGDFSFGDLARSAEAARQDALLTEVADVTADPPPGQFVDQVTVSLTTSTLGVTIFYTLDGTVPYTASLAYDPEAPLVLSEPGTHVVRAIAAHPDLGQSDYYQGQYVVTRSAQPVEAVSSSSGISGATLGGILGGAGACLICVIIPIAIVIYRKVQSRRISYTIGGDAPLLVQMADVDIIRSVGMGAFGEVSLASWRGSEVAVKQLIAVQVTPEVVDAFVSEASMVMHLRHRNIITFMGVCTEPLALITEFAHRGSLFDVLQNDNISIPFPRRVQWARDIATGMSFLHSASPPVYHRDFKSLNVLLDRNWTPKIADFGLSTFRETVTGAGKSKKKRKKKKTKGTAAGVTQSIGSFSGSQASLSSISSFTGDSGQGADDAQGSLYWTAPEVLANPQSFQARSDVYAYGVTLWEIFSRRELYEGENQFVVAWRVLQGDLRPAVGLLPPEADPIVPLMTRCWAGEPDQRPLFPEIVAEITDASYYTPDDVPLPTTSTEPQGRIVLTTIVFPDIQEGMNECAEAYCDALILAHAVLGRCIQECSGFLWKESLAEVSVAFNNPARWLTFVNVLADEFLSAPWSAALADTLVAGTQKNIHGHTVARGVRWTAAAAISEPTVSRNAATLEVTYQSPQVATVRQHARESGVPFCWVVSADLLDEGRATLTPVLPSKGGWEVVDAGAIWDCGGRERLLRCHRGAVVEMQEEHSSSSSSSPSPSPSSSSPSPSPSSSSPSPSPSPSSSSSSSSSHKPHEATEATKKAAEDKKATEDKNKNKNKNKKGKKDKKNKKKKDKENKKKKDKDGVPPQNTTTTAHDAGASGEMASVEEGITRRVQHRNNSWLVWPAQLDGVWDSLERFDVGTFSESLRGEWRNQQVIFKRLLRQKVPLEDMVAFLRQVHTARSIQHPLLLPIVGACVCAPRRTLIIPFCRNGSLANVLGHSSRTPKPTGATAVLPLAARVRIAQQIVEAVAFLHSQGMVFGALKPNNILVADDETIRLTDYGMLEQKNLGTMTQTSSATYEAPEVLLGQPRTAASDCFALGTILFELLSATQMPKGRNAMESAFMILQGQMPAFPDAMSQPLRDVVSACWKIEPVERINVAGLARMLADL